jgi:hypothetical protein
VGIVASFGEIRLLSPMRRDEHAGDMTDVVDPARSQVGGNGMLANIEETT